ncbi:MAG: XdhC family protein [Oscillospiraceae bacterium]
MKQIFSQLFYEVEKRRDTVLVTLIADRGSAPRKAGAQMLVGAEGRLVGTIGGGAVEGRSIQLCRELLDQRRSCIREFPCTRPRSRISAWSAAATSQPISSSFRRRIPCGTTPPAGPWLCWSSTPPGGWCWRRTAPPRRCWIRKPSLPAVCRRILPRPCGPRAFPWQRDTSPCLCLSVSGRCCSARDTFLRPCALC